MKKRASFAAFIVLVVGIGFLSGCTSSAPEGKGPPPSEFWIDTLAAEHPSEAILVFYRKKAFAGSALNFSIYIDRKEIAELGSGRFIVAAVAPGKHTFYGDEASDAFDMTVEAGKQHYFRFEIQAGLWKGHGVLSPIPSEQGRSQFYFMLEELRPSTDVKDATIVISKPGMQH